MTNQGNAGFPSAGNQFRADNLTGIAASAPSVRANLGIGNVAYPLASGESTIDRALATSNSVATATQRLLLTFFTAAKSELCTQVRIWSGGTAAGATPSLCRVGVYSVDASNNLTLQAAIANDTALFATQSTLYTRSFSGANLQKVAGVTYAVGVLVVSGATIPTFIGGGPMGTTGSSETLLVPTVCAKVDSQADLPATIDRSSLASNPGRVYTAVVP